MIVTIILETTEPSNSSNSSSDTDIAGACTVNGLGKLVAGIVDA